MTDFGIDTTNDKKLTEALRWHGMIKPKVKKVKKISKKQFDNAFELVKAYDPITSTFKEHNKAMKALNTILKFCDQGGEK